MESKMESNSCVKQLTEPNLELPVLELSTNDALNHPEIFSEKLKSHQRRVISALSEYDIKSLAYHFFLSREDQKVRNLRLRRESNRMMGRMIMENKTYDGFKDLPALGLKNE